MAGASGLSALDRVAAVADAHDAPDARTTLAPVRARLAKLLERLGAEVDRHPNRPDEAAHNPTVLPADIETNDDAAGHSAVVRSREDALRAVGAAIAFFNAREPGSPVAAALERGRALASMSAAERAGSISSRDEAVKALDGIADFFRRHEPSSPVPLFLERAKRMVAKDFLAILQDIAPDAVGQARQVGGVQDSSS